MKLDDVFNTDECVPTVQETNTQVATVDEEDTIIEYDYQSTRTNLYSLLNQGQDALLHALDLAKAKEEPRAYEVVGNLLKQLSDINTQLLDLTEKKQRLQDKEKKETQATITNNNAIFVGSTDELGKLLKGMKGE